MAESGREANDGIERFAHPPERAGQLTDLGCPDCRGVLALVDVGATGLMTFRCSVGHEFSLESLVPSKEDAVEKALWTTIEVYEELALLHAHLARARGNDSRLAAAFERRAEQARANAEALRAIVAGDKQASLDADSPAGARAGAGP